MLRVKCTIVKISNQCWNCRLNQNDSNIINTLTNYMCCLNNFVFIFTPTINHIQPLQYPRYSSFSRGVDAVDQNI